MIARNSLLAAALVLAAVSATACAKKGLEAPLDTGVCYAMAGSVENNTVKFNRVKEGVKSLEFCAAELERMRLGFLRMGGGIQEIAGSYQGRFLFLTKQGIYTGEKFDGPRYLILVRYNGKLVMPGAVPRD